nr:hypothetical protein [Desulfobacula sp.]
MTTKLCLFVLLLTLPNVFFAQSKHLEITVSDTVEVPVKAILYQLTISTELYEAGFYENQEVAPDTRAIEKARTSLIQQKRQELEVLLKANKLQFTPYRTDLYATSPSYREFSNGFLVTLKSKSEFLKFYEKLGSLDYVTGNIVTIEPDTNFDFESKVLAKLTTKAEQQITKLSKAAGVKHGKIVGIVEDGNTANFYGYAESYGASIGFSINYNSFKIYYGKSMKFMYELL